MLRALRFDRRRKRKRSALWKCDITSFSPLSLVSTSIKNENISGKDLVRSEGRYLEEIQRTSLRFGISQRDERVHFGATPRRRSTLFSQGSERALSLRQPREIRAPSRALSHANLSRRCDETPLPLPPHRRPIFIALSRR